MRDRKSQFHGWEAQRAVRRFYHSSELHRAPPRGHRRKARPAEVGSVKTVAADLREGGNPFLQIASLILNLPLMIERLIQPRPAAPTRPAVSSRNEKMLGDGTAQHARAGAGESKARFSSRPWRQSRRDLALTNSLCALVATAARDVLAVWPAPPTSEAQS